MRSQLSPTRQPSNAAGDQQAKRLRQYVINAVHDKTGVILPATQTLDQLVRHAAKAGVALHMYSSIVVQS